jgi:hypothetical protein
MAEAHHAREARAFSALAKSGGWGSRRGVGLIHCALQMRSEAWADTTARICASGWWTQPERPRVDRRQRALGSVPPRRSAPTRTEHKQKWSGASGESCRRPFLVMPLAPRLSREDQAGAFNIEGMRSPHAKRYANIDDSLTAHPNHQGSMTFTKREFCQRSTRR